MFIPTDPIFLYNFNTSTLQPKYPGVPVKVTGGYIEFLTEPTYGNKIDARGIDISAFVPKKSYDQTPTGTVELVHYTRNPYDDPYNPDFELYPPVITKVWECPLKDALVGASVPKEVFPVIMPERIGEVLYSVRLRVVDATASYDFLWFSGDISIAL